MRKLLLAIITSLFLVFGHGIPAQAAAGDLVIKHDWGSQRSGLTVYESWCSGGPCYTSRVGYLKRGQNTKSKYGWRDADGIYVPRYCTAFILGYLGEVYTGPRFVKISGGWGVTKNIRLRCY